jgi:hypothetical protein
MNTSSSGWQVEQRYDQGDFDRNRRIAESEARHANYDDPPQNKRWWQFWKRTEWAENGDTR